MDFYTQIDRPEIVTRDCIAEVDERIDYAGRIVVPLDLDGTEAAIKRLVEENGCEAIAVCCLFAFKNDTHEQQIKQAIQSRLYGRLRLNLERGESGLPRIRANGHDHSERLFRTGLLHLHGGGRRASRGPGLRWSAIGHAIQRRLVLGCGGADQAGDARCLRARRRHRELEPSGQDHPREEHPHRGHGGNELRCLGDLPGRTDHGQPRADRSVPDEPSDPRYHGDRCWRRLDRLDRQSRHDAGRPAERGREPGTGVLRPGRDASRP